MNATNNCENLWVCSAHYGPKHDLYGRYIDDCIGAISSKIEKSGAKIHFSNRHP